MEANFISVKKVGATVRVFFWDFLDWGSESKFLEVVVSFRVVAEVLAHVEVVIVVVFRVVEACQVLIELTVSASVEDIHKLKNCLFLLLQLSVFVRNRTSHTHNLLI